MRQSKAEGTVAGRGFDVPFTWVGGQQRPSKPRSDRWLGVRSVSGNRRTCIKVMQDEEVWCIQGTRRNQSWSPGVARDKNEARDVKWETDHSRLEKPSCVRLDELGYAVITPKSQWLNKEKIISHPYHTFRTDGKRLRSHGCSGIQSRELGHLIPAPRGAHRLSSFPGGGA